MASDSSQEQNGGHPEGTKRGRTVHFATPMDFCHLKNLELGQECHKYKGRVVLRGDAAKDDSEQGSSASQMTAAKVLDVIARLPGCAGQANDAVSAWTQVKMEDVSIWLKHPKSECPDSWIRPPRHRWPKSWHNIEEPVLLFERNLCEHPLAGLLWERQFEQVPLENGWERSTNLGMPVCA